MVKIYTPDDNRKGISQGLDNSLLAPIQANIESSEKTINQSNSQIQSQSSILQSKSDLAAINQRDRDNYRIGLQKALVAADRRDKVLRSETVGVDKTTEYSKYISDAMLQFTELSEKRKSMAVDENGNPMHDSLAKDTGKLGEMVKGRISSTIKDPLLKEKFDLEFGEFVTKSQIASYTTARAQRTEYNRVELGNSLTKLVDVGVRSGFETSGDSLVQAQRLVNSAVSHGVDVSTGNAMLESFKTELVSGKMNALITTDINKAKEVLNNNTPEALGMDPKMYLGYRVKVDSTVSALEANKLSALELDIRNGDINTESQVIDRSLDLNPENQRKAIRIFNSVAEKQVQSYKDRQEIEYRLNTQGTLTLDDSSTSNKLYAEDVKSLQGNLGQPLSIAQKVTLVGKYKGSSVKDFTNEIEGLLQVGNIQQKKEAVEAFEKARILNPQIVSTISQGALADIGIIEQTTKYANLNNSELETFIDKYKKLDPALKSDLSTQFNNSVDLTTLNDTLQTHLDTDGYFDLQADMDPEALNEYYTSTRNFYLINGGNYDAAASSAFKALRQSIGVSNIGGVERIMLRPPESNKNYALYGNNATYVIEKTLKDTIFNDAQLKDFDISKVRLKEIAGTERDGMYMVTTVDSSGSTSYLTSPDGSYIYFRPTKEELNAALATLGN